MRARLLLLLALVAAASVAAAAPGLQLTRASTVIADGVDTANPKALPGADVDAAITVTSPATNGVAAIGSVVVVDTIPPQAKLRVTDYGSAGGGPVGFVDGNLLGLGLLGSGLTYTYASLASASDGVEFYDGSSWSYVPTPDADGFDANVRAIRVTLTGGQVVGSAFQLRYRTRLR